ncbi:MAG TPA: bifunctional phosphoribosyl-AMP cyclohydrolase/phosphoribosyl-ATP diphosphatase HisIE [Kofleriaceae bacterium]|nr:bifunctional phosphoribosyl-AMP cyclohydrolase/phosphoribosyl-ATP diphosphatase HisIE [Kofleriaceae bacterium]
MPVEPQYDDRGLVPCIVQDAATGSVLMLAWMNGEALERTRETGVVHFWSRSRQALWKKGETSGNTLALVELRIDCDRDCLLARVHPAGPACHTGTTTCFFTRDDDLEDDGVPATTGQILSRLDRILAARRDAPTTAKPSYTRSLLDAGMPKILAKIAEEHGELAEELPGTDDGKTVHEAADLLYHVMVGLTARQISIDAVLAELGRRFGTSGIDEKASRPKRS